MIVVDWVVVVLLILVAILLAALIVISIKYWKLTLNNKRPPVLDQSVIKKQANDANTSSEYTGQYTSGDRSYSAIKDWVKGELIGQGGFAPVFMALDRSTGALFATKQVQMIRDKNRQRLFKDKVDALRKEIQTLSQLSHVNIVQYLGTSRSKTHLYLHLEYVAGGSLADFLSEFGILSLPLIQNYTQQILTGLEFLHSKGLVHRDITPSNILVYVLSPFCEF